MRVTIWDLDYYYAKVKKNCVNDDAMRISSYHKQCGDAVNFVLKEDDIYRPYDLYYIIKENANTPNPPLEFYANAKVRWWGAAVKMHIKWKMSAAMMGCRPDYLLYPEKNTLEERAIRMRFFDNAAKLLPAKQNEDNSFKNKKVIVTDKYMWYADKKSLILVLDQLKDIKNVSFLEPIQFKILLSDKDIENKFLELNFTNRSSMSFAAINYELFEAALDLYKRIAEKGRISLGPIIINYEAEEHWNSYLSATRDYRHIVNAILKGRQEGVPVVVKKLKHRLDTPYFHLFEELSKWSTQKMKTSWFQYLLLTHPKCNAALPSTWDDGFRDLLRQTYQNKELLLTIWKDKKQSENEIPWILLDEEFKYGI